METQGCIKAKGETDRPYLVHDRIAIKIDGRTKPVDTNTRRSLAENFASVLVQRFKDGTIQLCSELIWEVAA